jgi:uncharacterized membrane protein
MQTSPARALHAINLESRRMLRRAFHPLDPWKGRFRLSGAGVLAAITWLAMPSDLTFATRALGSWDAAGFTLLTLEWLTARRDSAETCRRAASRDPARMLGWIVVLCASAVMLVAATIVVHQASLVPRFEGKLLHVLCLATVAVSWLLTHTAFALRYAHLYYYRDGLEGEALEFPGNEKPDDLDFAYFAFTIGMCFQVSDCRILSRRLRRTALAHAFVAFGYNTVVFALAVNLIVRHAG